MPVGTAATVKGLTPDEVAARTADLARKHVSSVVAAGAKTSIVEAGGLHRFMAWDGPILTDSGGFQVFSLQERRKLDDDGVTFQSHIDGSTHRFTPETVIAFEEALGVDIAMVLDVCVKLPATREELEDVGAHDDARGRNARARRGEREETAVFAIVQGGLDRGAARAQRARARRAGFSRLRDRRALRRRDARRDVRHGARVRRAPTDEKPRYLMGVGTVRDIIMAVDCGIDMFDCVYPTRCGRNGRAMTRNGEFNICNAPTCAISRRSIRRATATSARRTRAPISLIFSARTKCSARACSRIITSTCSTT